MAYIKSYKELIVWQRAMELVREVYLLTGTFPKSELYVLVSQLRRSSVSIPSNIAEGYGRKSTKEYLQYYYIAYGSALELETQILISKQLKLADEKDFIVIEKLLDEVCRMLNSITNKLNAKR
jgi:four helix bundle protein